MTYTTDFLLRLESYILICFLLLTTSNILCLRSPTCRAHEVAQASRPKKIDYFYEFSKNSDAGSEGTLRARLQRQGTKAEMKDEDSESGTGAKWHPCWVSPGGFLGGSWGASWGTWGVSWGARGASWAAPGGAWIFSFGCSDVFFGFVVWIFLGRRRRPGNRFSNRSFKPDF